MPGRHYWGFRVNHREYGAALTEELRNGRLRQGWAYEDRLNLEMIDEKRRSGESLDADEKAAWRNHAMLVGNAGEMSLGDYVLVKNLPTYGRATICEVVNRYSFGPPIAGSHDYRHTVGVKVIVEDASPLNLAVTAGLRKSFKCRSRIWNLDPHADAIQAWLSSDPTVPADHLQRMEKLRAAAEDALIAELGQQFGDADFEQPVVDLLRRIYPDADVTHTGGRREAGCDVYVSQFQDPFGTDQAIAVQVKAYFGGAAEPALKHAIEQICIACNSPRYETFPITQGIVLTLLDEIPESIEIAAVRASEETGVPIAVIGRDRVAPMLMRVLPDLTATVAPES